MGNKKKMVFNVLFLVLIFAGTIYGVFHGEDIGQISDILQTVNPWWLIPGVVCVVVFIWGRINYHSLYDAKSWSEGRQGNLFPVLVGWILL